MDQTTKQTALFFGFLAAAMTQVSAERVSAAELQTPPAVQASAEKQPVARDAAARKVAADVAARVERAPKAAKPPRKAAGA